MSTGQRRTVEYVPDTAHAGPAVLVHRGVGPYHAQDNPGTAVAAFDANDGVHEEMSPPEIAALVGVDVDSMRLTAEGHSACWELDD